ncbi:transcriptional regulator, LacI family [Beutenbergia cavernae DSM 12333]|uniref:Transcriptional regulator, LacI family n=1 Tax=Beutenbergia cavernae (strain ATCC BAA-8 / DSM 12333 / CCUG 43141 / JCM 11478 / NBRC 16432 / NCIMB 13614 / HKI 0122) TaxID=471853 RepID=C5BXW2_BEUC1|nr:LacI family DNA-binding transcriptional regulator [Beutenbergia cavernae]ACQ78856.1 transcriptional regulator, LacI family [Beutenbergia cavernae DSM 12333]
MAVTLADIAARADLSESTVSRALSAPDKVNPATRERVLAIAKELGYVPNRVARSLSSGRTDLIGLVVPDIANPFFPPIIKAVQARAAIKGWTVLIADIDERAADELPLARTIRRRVDGLVIASPRTGADRLGELAQLAPVVFINREIPGSTSVIIDAGDGMGQAVEHLAALGHRTIAYLNGPRRSWSNEQRRHAVEQTAERLGLTLVQHGPFEPQVQSGVHAADLVLAGEATGVIAYDDLIALGVLARVAERGLRVGTDLSVIGVDDSPMSAMAYPTLTSVHVPGTEAGVTAVDTLLALIDEPDSGPGHVTLETQLVVRSSTGPVAAR